MKAFNKIGFHTSVGGNPTGISDYLKKLDAAGVPFFIKAADAMTGIFEAQEIMRQSNVPHTAVYRRSVRFPGISDYDPDLADYNLEPEAAAEKHWKLHKAHFPTDLDPKLTWVETINEPRQQVEWADWLGKVAVHMGQMAIADGFKFAAFGYATGNPDDGAWETDGMLAYLELCQQHPDQLGVALHEYSLKLDNIWFMRGHLIGRFEELFRTCDRHKIKRPKVLITEWGWTHNRVPAPEIAMKHIREVAEYYAQFPELLGAAIWYLGGGFGGIANFAQKLIKPVTEFSIQTTFDIPDPDTPVSLPVRPPMTPEPAPPPSGTESPPAMPNATFIRDITIPDDSRLPVGSTFTKKWLVENSGNVAWTADYKLVHVSGQPMTDQTVRDLPPAQPGEQVEIAIPMRVPNTPGVHISDWRFRDPQGNFFGDFVYTRIIAERPLPTTGIPDSKFIADVTIPDDTKISPGQTFVKTWRVKNVGTRAWGNGFTLEFIGGVAMTEKTSIPLPATPPGQEIDISIPMTAPDIPGDYQGDWRMKDDQGNFFGATLWVRIVVPWQSGLSLTRPLSQRDPLWAKERLGHPGSPKTIGEWGCLVTCFAMVANAFGRNITPLQLNNRMMRTGGFLNLYLTKWNALSSAYQDIVYEGKLEGRSTPDLLKRIDASLAKGWPVTVHVDFTSDTPYTENDQHWVVIVGKDGDDYRINDPWLLPPQEVSLRARYGRPGRPLQDAIISAIFYRPANVQPDVNRETGPITAVSRLATGMNVNPDAPHSNPYTTDDLKGLDWVRFVFKLAARPKVAERNDLSAAFAQYDPIIRAYNRMGIKSLIILNQETVWGNAPWQGNQDWQQYANQLADVAGKIARHYRRYGENVAYEIWNEGDKPHNPASVFVPADRFAIILKKVAAAIRAHAPNSPLVFGGLATGPEESIAYLQQCKNALNGPWPVDAIGIHPYTRWATRAPFDWGQHYGTLAEAFDKYKKAFPDMPFWITEIGVADDREIGAQFYPEIADYMKDVYKYVADRYAKDVPVVIWFAWSDWMRNAGIVDKEGQRKPHIYDAFRLVRNREL